MATIDICNIKKKLVSGNTLDDHQGSRMES